MRKPVAEGKARGKCRCNWAWDGLGTGTTIAGLAIGLVAGGHNWKDSVRLRRWGVAHFTVETAGMSVS